MQKSTITISTKVNLQAYAIIEGIMHKYNINKYKMLQVVIDAYIRYLDTGTIITNHLRNMVNGFVDLQNSESAFAVCEPSAEDLQIKSGILLLEKKGAKWKQPVLIEKRKDGELLQTYNHDRITTEILNSLDPELAIILEQVKEENNLLSITDALKFAIRDSIDPKGDIIHEDIMELFSDNERSEGGQGLGYEEKGQYIKRNTRKLNNIR